jgi:ATP/maltotriose-dependent transcriptional regulator MalT
MERLERAKSLKDRLEAQRLAAIEELRHSVQELRHLGDAITRSRRDGAGAPTHPPAEQPHAPDGGAVELGERFGLSRRELEVALLIAQGFSNREIAETIRVSTHTARHHTQHVLGKLGVRSRSRAAALINDLLGGGRSRK